jgi:F-type H+-transporting ATPase subunit epsilon
MPVTLKLVTPVKVLPPEVGVQVTVTASDGEIGIRQGHAPLVALVGHGRVSVSGGKTFAVRGGVAQVLKDEVNVLVDEAIEVGQIDVAKVQARLEAISGGADAKAADEVAWLKAQLVVAARAKAAAAAH